MILVRVCLLLLSLLLVGCASSNTPTVSNDVDSNGQPVSTIPWNKPQSWESGGALGSMMNQ